MLGGWLRTLSNTVSRSFQKTLESSDVSVVEWVILRSLHASGAPLAPSDIAQDIGLTRGAVSKLVDRLIAKGLVTRTESLSDRRYQVIDLTNSGRDLIPNLFRIAKANDETFFTCLTKSERSELERLIKKVIQHNEINQIPLK